MNDYGCENCRSDAASIMVSGKDQNKSEVREMKKQTQDFKLTMRDIVIDHEPEKMAVEDVVMDIRFSKPVTRQYFRTRPGELGVSSHIYAFIEDSYDNARTIYLVARDVFEQYRSECFLANLVTCINRQGSLFLWPLRIDKGKRVNSWNRSAREAAIMAEKYWMAKRPNQPGVNFYNFKRALGNLDEPKWPDKKFEEIIEIAIRNYFINDSNHPVMQAILGF